MNRKVLSFQAPTLSALRARAAMVLIAMFCFAGGAWAQQALPYEYGFEDNYLAADGWTANLSSTNSGIYTGGAEHSGTYGFAFSYSEQNASLISPLLTGGGNYTIEVSFWYKEYSSTYGDEQFYVGYTTDESVTNPDDFTYGDIITASLDWQQYQNTFPAGTKRIAIKYVYNDAFYLFLDDFEFDTNDGFKKPANLAASEITKNSAQLSWTEKGTATAWVVAYKADGDSDFTEVNTTENPFTLNGLTPETKYTVKVRPAGETNKWSNEITFTTAPAFPAPTDLAANNVLATTADISWTADENATGAVLEYANAEGAISFSEYKYDNGTFAGNTGMGSGAFRWGVMFPAGSYTGNTVFKVSVYDPTAMTGSVTIYNDGDTAPANAVATVPVIFTGVGDFIDIEVNATIDDTKNVWVIFNNESGAGYPAAGSTDDLGDANGRWVELSGTWYDLANAGVSNRAFMIHAEIGTTDLSALTWTTVENATSPCQLTGLTPETPYMVRVKSLFAENNESAWTSTSFTTLAADVPPTNLAADVTATTATLSWVGSQDSYNVQYREAAFITDTFFFDDFENGLDQWTITAGDEATHPSSGIWYTINPYNGLSFESHSGTYCASSWSWNSSAYNADNWLITPQVTFGGTLKFWVRTSDEFPDSYEVLLSTGGNTTEDFTVTLQDMAAAPNNGEWNEVTIDLSTYAGQTGYIAIHHQDYDMNYLVIDDFGIYNIEEAGEWISDSADEATLTLTFLMPNTKYEWQVQGNLTEGTTEWSEVATFTTDDLLELELADDGIGNSDIIGTYERLTTNVKLTGRTLYKDRKWNTICLPFNVDIEGSVLEGAIARELTEANITGYGEPEETTLNLKFSATVSELVAGKPYIIRWTDGEDIKDPVFEGVTLDATENFFESGSGETRVCFLGNYDAMYFSDAESESVLLMGGDNTLYYAREGAGLGACRAYFEIGENGYGARVTSFSINFGDTTTGIRSIENGPSTNGDAWYSLDGRKLNGQPAMKGVYINKGNKVTIK